MLPQNSLCIIDNESPYYLEMSGSQQGDTSQLDRVRFLGFGTGMDGPASCTRR